MKQCLRGLVMSMTLAAATSMTAAANADQDSAQAALEGISASAASTASSSDTPAPDATAHHHHHHHEETPKAKDKDEAPAPASSASAAPVASAQPPATSAAPVASAPAPAPVETAKPLQLRESHDAHPITLAPEPASGAMWKVGAILVVLGAAAWALKKNRSQKPADTVKSLEVLRRLSIGVRTELIVVDVDGQRLLLGVTPNAIQTLASLPDPDVDAHAEIAATTSSQIGDRLAALVESSRANAHESMPPRASEAASRRAITIAPTSKRAMRKSAAVAFAESDAIEGQARGLAKIGHRP